MNIGILYCGFFVNITLVAVTATEVGSFCSCWKIAITLTTPSVGGRHPSLRRAG